jgi:iron complex outermembrane receptor protein
MHCSDAFAGWRGVYALRLTESDDVVYTYNDQYYRVRAAAASAASTAPPMSALYGSLDADVGSSSTLSGGLRVEQRQAHYADSADAQTPFPTQTNHMVGGNLSWETRWQTATSVCDAGARLQGRRLQYRLADPVRAAQFQPGDAVEPRDRREARARGQRAAAASRCVLHAPSNMQVYLAEQLQQNNPAGLCVLHPECQQRRELRPGRRGRYRLGRWQFSGSGSLLRTSYLGVTGQFAALGLEGRAQPFAPGYKLSAAVEYRHPAGWFARLDASAIGSFYYYTSDAQASSAYNLENVRDRLPATRVDHEPLGAQCIRCPLCAAGILFRAGAAGLPTQSFLQRGDPRQVGITVNYTLR